MGEGSEPSKLFLQVRGWGAWVGRAAEMIQALKSSETANGIGTRRLHKASIGMACPNKGSFKGEGRPGKGTSRVRGWGRAVACCFLRSGQQNAQYRTQSPDFQRILSEITGF